MKVVLDFRPRGHLESRLAEDVLDAQSRARHRMQAAGFLPAARQGHIEGALGEFLLELRLLQADAVHLQRRLNRRLGVVDSLARRGTFGGRERAQALELLGQQPLLAQHPHAHLVQSGKARRRIHVCEPLLDER